MEKLCVDGRGERGKLAENGEREFSLPTQLTLRIEKMMERLLSVNRRGNRTDTVKWDGCTHSWLE